MSLRVPIAQSPPTPPILSARGLSRIYRMGEVTVVALKNVDFDLAAGEMVTILGPSGSGKSTLLNILGGLDAPTQGTLSFRGEPLLRFDERTLTRYRREHVGFVFQFYNLIPSLTARENVALVTDVAPNPMAPEEALGAGYSPSWQSGCGGGAGKSP